MKRYILAIILTSLWITTIAQENVVEQEKLRGKHKGLLISASVGPVFGNISDHYRSFNYYTGFTGYKGKIIGAGVIGDLKLGVAVVSNFILHAEIKSSSMFGPRLEMASGESINAKNSIAIHESLFGFGVTKYIMPINIFIAGTIGVGRFSFVDDNDRAKSFKTDKGGGYQIKVGKEWMLNPMIGLGIAATYGQLGVYHSFDDGANEDLLSKRFGVALNLTYNKIKYVNRNRN